jgi:hypothetical protein
MLYRHIAVVIFGVIANVAITLLSSSLFQRDGRSFHSDSSITLGALTVAVQFVLSALPTFLCGYFASSQPVRVGAAVGLFSSILGTLGKFRAKGLEFGVHPFSDHIFLANLILPIPEAILLGAVIACAGAYFRVRTSNNSLKADVPDGPRP